MSTTTILILGAGQMQVPAIEAARSMGWRSIVADANPDAPFARLGDVFEHVDLADAEAMLAMARTWHERGELQGVFTAGTDFSATVARVAEALGLPGNRHEAALNASIKSRMRACFARHGLPSPRFVTANGSAIPDTAGLDYPLVVKPVDNMGARGVSKVARPDELPAALELARRHSRSQSAIVEEYIEGPEYSLDSLLVNGRLVPCGLARRHIRFPPYFVELGHTLPSELDPAAAEAMFKVLEAAAQACGLSTGAVKGDMFMTSRGPVIGEIAARLSGGYMSGWTYPLASGVDLTRAALRLAVGLDPGLLEPHHHHTSAERALVSIPGTLASITGLEQAQALPGVKDIFLRARQGSALVFPRNNVEKAGNILACLPQRQAAMDAAESAVRAVCLELQAPDALTDAWLDGPWHHPDQNGPAASVPAAYPALVPIAEALPSRQDPAVPVAGELALALPAQLAELLDKVPSCPWDYRSPAQALAMIQQRRHLRIASDGAQWPRFWTALARGGMQAALYTLDCLDPQGRLCR